MLRGIPREGLKCNSCGALYRINVLFLIVPLLIGFLINMVFLAVQSPYFTIYTQFIIALPLMFLFVIKKPLVLVGNAQSNTKNIKWYASPVLYVGIAFIIVLYFMFK